MKAKLLFVTRVLTCFLCRRFRYLNGLGPIQVGGIENMPLEYPSSEYVLYKSFRGCIRKIRENLEMYDLGYPLKVVNAPVGCTLMAKCPSCKNGGYCYPGFSRSICTCPMGFIGDDCSGSKSRVNVQFWYIDVKRRKTFQISN